MAIKYILSDKWDHEFKVFPENPFPEYFYRLRVMLPNDIDIQITGGLSQAKELQALAKSIIKVVK